MQSNRRFLNYKETETVFLSQFIGGLSAHTQKKKNYNYSNQLTRLSKG